MEGDYKILPNSVNLSDRISDEDTWILKNYLENIIKVLHNECLKCINSFIKIIKFRTRDLEDVRCEIPVTQYNSKCDIYISDINKLTIYDIVDTTLCVNVTGDSKVKINYEGPKLSNILYNILVDMKLDDKYYIDTNTINNGTIVEVKYCKIIE